jgi:UDP-3-O-[3-hydroxymyristoyl] N-acetylglucosamine deacetylase
MLRQRTIKRAIHAIGIGVHSGNKVRMTLRPAGENTGILFVRTDAGHAVVRARAQNVSDTTLATRISENGVQVSTVEHLMSALWGLGIDNVVVEINNDEVPIMDGSAAPFVYLMNSVGIVEQNAWKKFIRVTREIRVTLGDAVATLQPYDGFTADYTFVADHPVYNRYPKRSRVDFSHASYAVDVSRARSFGLIKELAQAQTIGRCLGSSLDNAVGIDDSQILNDDGLRYEDEFVKHKLLDVIGDLYLVGSPVLGRFQGHKSGHALNNKLARTLLECTDAWEVTTVAEQDLRRPTAIPQSAVV